MGQKSVQKIAYILEQAEKIFAKKGFKNVTMKDIVIACNISRGGVYLYFNDTKEIFEAILQQRAKVEETTSKQQIDTTPSAKEQIRNFLNIQKKELLNPGGSLIIATYEYLFAQSSMLSKVELNKKFQNVTNQLAMLIQLGIDNGEFFVKPDVAAQNIVLLLEGLRISSTVLSFDEEFLDHQIEYILSQLEGWCSE